MSASVGKTVDEVIYKTIKEYFDVNSNEVTGDQRKQVKHFFASSADSTQLVILKSDESPNHIQLHTRQLSDQQLDEDNHMNRRDSTVVFVKLSQNSGQKSSDVTTDESIISETESIARLRRILHRMDGSVSALMHALSELRRQARTRQVLTALTAERRDLVLKVNDWADVCADTSELADTNPEITDRISVLKAREGKLRAVMRVCDQLFGEDIQEYQKSKTSLDQICRELADESQRLFREWCKRVNGVSLDARRQCIEIDTSTQVPRVTFDPKMVKLAADTGVLRCLGFAIPADILTAESDAKKYGGYARELREIVNFYCSVADQILLSQRPMLIGPAQKFTALLEASRERMSWADDSNKLMVWLDELKAFAKQFASENRLLRRHHQKVLLLIRNLFDVQVVKWRPIITDAKTLVQEIDYRYENTGPWKRHWDHQLYKILEFHFNDTLIKSDNLLSFGVNNNKSSFAFRSTTKSTGAGGGSDDQQLKIELCFSTGVVAYRPPLEELKAKIYARIKTFLSLPEKFEGFSQLNGNQNNANNNDTNNKSLFYAIYLRNFNNFPILYEKGNEIIDELLTIRHTFVEWCSLYHVIRWQTTSSNSEGDIKDGESLAQFLKLDTLDDYKNNLILIKTKSQKFNKQFADNEIVCRTGSFVINILPIKAFVDWLLIEADKLLVRSLRDRCDEEIKVIERKCNELLDMTSKRPDSIQELLAIDRLFKTELKAIQTDLNERYAELEAKLAFLMKWSSKTAPDLSEVRQKFDEFERITETKDSLLDSYKEILKSRMEAELGNTSAEIQQFVSRWQSMGDDMKETKEVIREYRVECDSLAQRCQEFSLSCDYFSAPKPKSFEVFALVVDEVLDTDAKWTLIHDFEAGIDKYLDMEWIVSRNKLSAIESYISKWEEDNPSVGPLLTNRVREWRELLALLKICRGECFVKSHWQEFLSLIGLAMDYEKLKLSDLLKQRKQLVMSRDAIKELNTKASNEMSIRETFNELDSFAASAQLALYDHQMSDGVPVRAIRDWRSILNRVSECSLTLQTVKNTEFFGTNDLQERSALWESRLSQLDSILGLLNGVQRKWISLEPIYARDDTGMFTDYTFAPSSRDFQEILKLVAKDPHAMRLLHIPGLETRLQAIDRTLNACQKKLQTFMEESRARFPRFYFLADDDLLLILAGKVDVNQSSTLLKKLFNNTVCKIHLDSSQKSVVSVESLEGEIIRLKQPVVIESGRGAHGVELWLKNLETQLKNGLKEQFFDALSEIEMNAGVGGANTHQWELAAQLLSLINWVTFTQRVEDSIRKHRLSDLKAQYEKELSSLTTGQDLEFESVLNIKVKSLVLDNIHFLTVIDELVAGDVRDSDDWLWHKQLRFYANKRRTNGLLEARMGLASFEYSFEYLGCFGASKLVHTPLTDKCYLTLTQAMEMGLGGNPYGPAGTGKTESVKALGQHLGRQVMVFNCDEAIDVKAMTRILVGLIKCGAWGCFDEFNRLQLDVLSALSSQIQAIQWAIKNKSKSVLLPEYGEVDINTFAAIFITLNPAGKQYGGRNRLPDNLKSLFLPIAMSVPDNDIISRVLLLAEGFELSQSQTLGQKLTLWFELARHCMTHQRHYDWGLRAIKTCLEASGRAIRLGGAGTEKDREAKVEVRLVTDTLRKQIKSKLVDEDDYKFEELVNDVFGREIGPPDATGAGVQNELMRCVVKVLEDKQLILDQTQITKISELEEQLESRLGVVIVGQSGSGKSTLWQVLKEARKQFTPNRPTTSVIINPKSVSRQQLLGYVDEETREWRDGLLTHKSREIARDESDTHFWLVFDGDIDPDWVEALNSVLDDNRILTLPTGERINFDPKRCNLLFETTSLAFASPATISRLGVVCVNGCKYPELLSAGLKQLDVQVSSEELQRYISETDRRLWVSLTRTLLSHISYAKREDSDPIKGILRVQRNLQTFDAKLNLKSGPLIPVPTVMKALELMKPWIDSESHILLTGSKGCGKSALAMQTVLSTGHTVTINCTPDTGASHIIEALKKSCTLITTGSTKTWRSLVANNKIILYVKNIELLSADKWQTKSVQALLTQLITYGGLYDDLSYDWCQMSRFQVVATCTHFKYVDTRLLSLMHVVDVEVPPVAELEVIFLAKMPDQCPYRQAFVKGFTKMYKELQTYSDKKPLDWLRVGVEIIGSLRHYSDINASVLRYEFWRAFYSQLEADSGRHILDSMLNNIFGSSDRDVVYASVNGSSKFSAQTADQFSAQIKRTVSSWINETEIQDPVLALIPETIALFAECNVFLKDNENCQMEGLVLVGDSGTGRKVALKSISHSFGYDTIWSPKQAYNEKQLGAELSALLVSDEEREERKVLIIVDEIHMHLIRHLRDKIYDILCTRNSKSMVRIALVISELNGVNESMWSRVCHIHTCAKWSRQSLIQLPPLITGAVTGTGGPVAEELSQNFVKIYELFADKQAHMRKYLSLIHVFCQILIKKSQELEKHSEHLLTGVSKLESAGAEVDKLRSEATEQKALLAAKRQEADDALHLITNSMHGAEDQKVELEDIRARTERETQKLTVRKKEIDAELKQIEPVLNQAKQAVGSIRSESLAEIRSLRAPPEVIRDILEGVLRLMGVNDTSWVSMKSFLSRRGVKDEIMNFESRKITPDMRVKVESLLQNHSDSFEASAARRASVAAAPLAEWVKANVAFSRVLHKIKPLEDEQNRLESGLRSAQTRINSLSNQLEGVETEVGALRDRLNHVTVEAAQIEVGLKQTNQTLSQSEKLITDLSGEFSRWKQQLRDIEEMVAALPVRAIIASAYVVYCSDEPSTEKRRQLFQLCCQSLAVPEFDLQAFLNSATEEEVFVSAGALCSHQTPFICDPTRKILALNAFETNCEITDTRSRDWIKVMELSLRFGRTLVINDFQRLEFPLLPVLRKEIYGGIDSRNWIFIGDKRVDYNRNFRLFLIGPELSAGVADDPLFNIINLSPSGSGMSSRLLSLVIECRRPELEAKKLEIERQKLRLESELRELESKLLSKLMESTGNLLNNTELVQSLNELKGSALSVEQSLRESAKLATDLQRERAEYESLAHFSSHLYFLVRELVSLKPMYRFGVAEYESVFRESLNRYKDLTPKQLLQDMYEYVSRGLFPEDRITFERFVRKRCPKEGQTLRADHTINVREFVRLIYGSDKKVALIMTAPGSDPTGEVQQIAGELRVNQFTILSMGSDVLGQAEQAIAGTGSADNIELLCLTNLHLVIGWLPALQRMLMAANSSVSPNRKQTFVILCTESCVEFPVSLLEMSVKYAYESAPGLRHQLKLLTADVSVPELKILSYLHAVCCERRHYVPQGWTKAYEFGFTDFRSASNVVQTVLTEKDRRLRPEFIRGILGAVIYGGKLDTSVDNDILQALINRWFNNNSSKDTDPTDEISVLGLSRNVDKLRQTALESRLTKGLAVLENATNSDKSGDKELERLRVLWRQLNINKTFSDTSGRPSATGSPIDGYLSSELSQTQRLVQRMDGDINGTDSEFIGDQLAINETPDPWLTQWPNGPKSADTFMRCAAFMASEVKRLSDARGEQEFNLSHLFQPNSLLNALRQQASRSLNTTVDQLRLYCAWGRQSLSTGSAQAMRYTLTGIAIEGAIYDDLQLRDCTQDSPLQSDMPPLVLHFLSNDGPEPYDSQQVVRLPLYGNSSRETVVGHLDVPVGRGTQSHWTECAVSFVIKYSHSV